MRQVFNKGIHVFRDVKKNKMYWAPTPSIHQYAPIKHYPLSLSLPNTPSTWASPGCNSTTRSYHGWIRKSQNDYCLHHRLIHPCITAASMPVESPDQYSPMHIHEEYKEFKYAYCKIITIGLPPHRSYDCAISVLPGTPPLHNHVYPLSLTKQKAMEGHYVQEALQQGYIRPLSSPASVHQIPGSEPNSHEVSSSPTSSAFSIRTAVICTYLYQTGPLLRMRRVENDCQHQLWSLWIYSHAVWALLYPLIIPMSWMLYYKICWENSWSFTYMIL